MFVVCVSMCRAGAARASHPDDEKKMAELQAASVLRWH